jgi:TolB-like protein
MSNEPEQEHFSDGITEDIITALSKVSNLLVIARNSTFIYKDRAVDVKQVGRDQGVRYVLEGSVRKAGNRVRITAQLVDATTGQHRWAERYDRDLEDIFAVQDEITRKIVTALDVHLREGEQARFWSSGTENLEAWECVRLGSDLLDAYRAEDVPEAKRLSQRAIDLDPEYAAAWVLLAGSHFHAADDSRHPEEERERALKSVRDCAQQALKLDPSCAEAYSMLGLYYLSLREYEEAVANAERSVVLAPNYAINIAISAVILNKCGQPKRAMERIRKAMRLSPVYPTWFLSILGQASRLVGMTDTAIDAYSELISREPDSLVGHVCLTSIFSELNREKEANASAAEVLRVNPDFSIKKYMDGLSYRDPAEATRFEEGLRKAGLPE